MKLRYRNTTWHILFYGTISGVILNPSTGETETLSSVDIIGMSEEFKFPR